MTPKSASSGPTSKNFRLRRQESACGTAPTGRRVPTGTRRRCAFQYSTRNTSAPMGGPVFFLACGAGKGQGGKKGLQQKTEKLLRSILLIRAFLERAGERPTCSGARASKATGGDRHEEREPQQSTRQKHGVEQSTAPSRAAAARDDGSSCVRAVELQIVSSARDPKIFGLRRCGIAPEAPIFPAPRGAQGAPKKWSHR